MRETTNIRTIWIKGNRGNWVVYERGVSGNALQIPSNYHRRVRTFTNLTKARSFLKSVVKADHKGERQ